MMLHQLGIQLRTLRNRRSWSVNDLALRAGLNPLSLRKIESGERRYPRIDTMVKIAQALGVSLDDLIKG